MDYLRGGVDMSAINQIMVALKATPIEHGVFVGTNPSTWTVPFGITEITVEAIGAGDDGIRGSTGPGDGGGHGAGGGGTRNETAGTTAGSGTDGVIAITY
jgi:hypothetical protein